jgi:hypothetical protein
MFSHIAELKAGDWKVEETSLEKIPSLHKSVSKCTIAFFGNS